MRKPILRYKRFWLVLIFLAGSLYLLTLRPIQIILQTAPDQPRDIAAKPSLTFESRTDWLDTKWNKFQDLEAYLYGEFPASMNISVTERQIIDTPLDLEMAEIEVLQFNVTTESDPVGRPLDFILLKPADGTPPKALIITQTFCPANNVVPYQGVPKPKDLEFSCEGNALASAIMHYFFGRYIVSPPFEDILAEGYAIGVMFPPQYIADSPELARKQTDELFAHLSPAERPGALMSWAALSVLTAEIFRMEYETIIASGHSRYGKTALLAGAYTIDIDGVIAHQSGAAGASLFRDNPGETLGDLTAKYPHWLGRRAHEYSSHPESLSFDQHYLLALLAPKPVLLGNARRDVWSDPEGAFRAARAASSIYQELGANGLTAERLGQFKPEDSLSFWIRPGTHGVVKEDWQAFLEFLNAHFSVK